MTQHEHEVGSLDEVTESGLRVVEIDGTQNSANSRRRCAASGGRHVPARWGTVGRGRALGRPSHLSLA